MARVKEDERQFYHRCQILHRFQCHVGLVVDVVKLPKTLSVSSFLSTNAALSLMVVVVVMVVVVEDEDYYAKLCQVLLEEPGLGCVCLLADQTFQITAAW